MAKISLSKITPVKKIDPIMITLGDQNIEVIQYLPVQEKMEMLEHILSHAIDDTGFFNPTRLEVFFTLFMIKTYTNISITEKMIEEAPKTYDLLEMNGVIEKIVSAIPAEEYASILNATEETAQHVSQHLTSFASMLTNILEDYKSAQMDVDTMAQTLSDPAQMGLVRDVLAKMG